MNGSFEASEKSPKHRSEGAPFMKAGAVGVRSGGGGVGRVGGPSLGSSRGISVSRPGFTSVRSFGPVASRMKPEGQGFGRGPESRNSAPIRAESKWAKPSSKWNFLKKAPRLTLGTPRSASEASFRSLKPIAETKPLKSVEKTARFNPYNQRGRERFAYRQAARRPIESSLNPNVRSQINDILASAVAPRGSERVISKTRIDALRSRYAKNAAVEAVQKTPQVEVKKPAQIIEFPTARTASKGETKGYTKTHIHIEQNRILAERRARSMLRLQPLIDAGVLTSAQAKQAVETATTPQTQTNKKTETKLKTLTLQERIVRVKEYRKGKLAKKEAKKPQSREKRVPFSVDWKTFVFRYENAKAQVEQATTGNIVDFKKVAEKISLDSNNISEAAHKLNNHKDGSLPTFMQNLAGLGPVDKNRASDRIYDSVLKNRPVRIDQGDKVTPDEVEKNLDLETVIQESNHPLGETIIRRAAMLIYKTNILETQETSEAAEVKPDLKPETEGKVIAFPVQGSLNNASLQLDDKPLFEQSQLFQSNFLKPAA